MSQNDFPILCVFACAFVEGAPGPHEERAGRVPEADEAGAADESGGDLVA